MKKLNIMVDLDDVIADFVPHFLGFLNKEYDAGLNENNIKGWNIWDYGNLTKEEYEQGLEKFTQSRQYNNLPVVENARESLKKLKENIIYIVTWRNKKVESETIEWLKRNSIHYDKLFFSNNKPKDKICKRLNIDVAIDDSPSQSKRLSNFCLVLLYNKRWNETVTGNNIKRVYNWDDIMNEIELIKK